MVGGALGGPIVVGYYPSSKKPEMPTVDFSMYTHINLAYAIPNSDGTFSFDGDGFVTQVALICIGGWTGSNYFSNILKNPSTSDKMIQNIADYIKKNDLDGVDIDWQYPGRPGDDCNSYDPQNDAQNYLAFLTRLRQQFDFTFGEHRKLITLAVRVQPFDGPAGPMSNVSEFAKPVDYASLMQYDINGYWTTLTGHNAPFNFENGKGLPASFVSAIGNWTAAGWPVNKLIAGLAFSGRSTQALEDMTQDPNNQYQPQSNKVPLGDVEDAPVFDPCAGAGPQQNSGIWQWKHLRDQGVLSSPTTANSPWVRQWDAVSQTPWLFNPQSKIFISYDDPQSIKIKVDYAASKGLAGFMVRSINMDSPNYELLNVAKSMQPLVATA
ncbi:Uncharacterized protein TCAP_03602 [Tolypocladium capitatum]|uniref:chitinase n=1 Tax=Tolypocladium capitatum TaxID=45235 RepID=A0A2K3QG05_9HYPO|nr:Uncharacterized protein TCAP_03602 [Tolypocladium capitatum]